MTGSSLRRGGFTLIELMVTVAVMLVLVAIAQPSLESLRQRAAIRGAGEHLLSFWNQARFEASKRNRLVKVGVYRASGQFCLGAATTTNPVDDTPCDCTVAEPAANVCDIARFPSESADWNGVQLSGMTLGGGADLSDMQPAVIEPRRTALVAAADEGMVALSNPPGRFQYQLSLRVNRHGRASLCEPASASNRLPDFGGRQCAE